MKPRTKTKAPAKAEDEQKQTRITRAIRVEIAKPLSMPWSDFGALLHDRRAVMHRLLQAGVLYLASESERNPEWQGTALAGIKNELANWQKWYADMAEKSKDEAQRAMFERRAAMVLHSSITDAISRKCFDDLRKWRRMVKKTRLPSAKDGAPIYIRDGGWSLERDEDGYALSVALVGSSPECRRPGMIRVALRPSTGKHHAMLAKIADGLVKPGNCQIVLDEGARRKNGSKGKWFAVLSYSEERDQNPTPAGPSDRVLVVHRGQRNFLFALSNDGRVRPFPGGKFASIRSKPKARQNSVRHISVGERGDGAKGHGTERRYETHDVLDRKIANVTKTFCQQAASWVAKVARDFGCGTVYIEDYGGIDPDEERAIRRFVDRFPLYQLKEAIKWVHKRDQQFELREYAASFISQTCPRCGNQDAAQHKRRTGMFHCWACGFDRNADWVAAFNGARNAKIDVSVIEKSLAAQLRNAKEMRAVHEDMVSERAGMETLSQSAL